MATSATWYITQRSEALAIVHLTRRDDFTVAKAPSPDSDLDLLVTVGPKTQSSGRIFGVVLDPLLTTDLPSDSNGTLSLPPDSAPSPFLADIPFPVCCLRFVVDCDYGYYRWLVEPTINQAHQATLSIAATQEFKKLTNDELEAIANTINHWYNARTEKAIA